MREVEHNKHAFTAWCVLLPLGDAQNIFPRVQKISRHCRTLIVSHRNTQVWFHGTLGGRNHMCRRRRGWPQMSLQGACDVSFKLWKSTTESVLNGEQHESANMCRSLDEVVRVLNSAAPVLQICGFMPSQRRCVTAWSWRRSVCLNFRVPQTKPHLITSRITSMTLSLPRNSQNERYNWF